MANERQPSDSVLARAAALGAVAGLRSQLPLALLALELRRCHFAAGAPGTLAALRSDRAALALGLAAAAELVGDKLPITPSRLRPGSLVVRAIAGGAAGAVLAAGSRTAIWPPVVAGVAASFAGSFAGHRARAAAGRLTGLPDPVWAVAEDALAVTVGLAAISGGRDQR